MDINELRADGGLPLMIGTNGYIKYKISDGSTA